MANNGHNEKKKALRESIEDYKREAIFKSKVSKCVDHLYSAKRYLDSSIDQCDDQDLRKKLEKIRNVLGQDISLGYGFEESEPMTVINKLEKVRSGEIDT